MSHSNAFETREGQQISAALQAAATHLEEAELALCQVVATIGGSAPVAPWHKLIHELAVIRDKVATHAP